MKAPLCRLCQVEHWSYQPHRWQSNKPVVESNKVFDKAAYQREYMRKRRAEAK